MFEPIPLHPLPETPLVSILTSNFNYGRFMSSAIESVQAQTYPSFEMIIVDDGSTDDSLQILSPYALSDTRIKALAKENGGQASAWNYAFARSHGSIICILDSDDLFTVDKVEQVVKTFQARPDVGLLVHPMLVIDSTGAPQRQIPPIINFEDGWIGPTVVARHGRWNTMPSSALSFRREVAELIFPMPENLGNTFADSFILRLAPLLTPVSSCDRPLALYRSHENNETNDSRRSTDPAYLQAVEERTYRTSVAVNERLLTAQLTDRLLPAKRSPRMLFWRSLLASSSPRQRLRLLVPLLHDNAGQDMDARAKRLARVAVYLAETVLPRPLRGKLMNRFFSYYSYQHAPRPWQKWKWTM